MHYQYPYTTTFPDLAYLEKLAEAERARFENTNSSLERLLTYSGVALNWMADYLLDPNVIWRNETIAIDSLYLTGTSPEWNKVIIDEAQRSPTKLHILIANKPALSEFFKNAQYDDSPILVRYEDDKNKVLNGMHRVIGAILDGKEHIEAFIGELKGATYTPVCEPHVVYDLLRAYIRGINPDRKGLIAALKFLRKAYSNVDELLKNRFGPDGIADDDIQAIIQDALTD